MVSNDRILPSLAWGRVPWVTGFLRGGEKNSRPLPRYDHRNRQNPDALSLGTFETKKAIRNGKHSTSTIIYPLDNDEVKGPLWISVKLLT